MATVSQDAIEQIAGRLAELEDEVQSYADELAEANQLIESLRLEITRLMADRSMAV